MSAADDHYNTTGETAKGSLAEALAAFQGELKTIPKNSTAKIGNSYTYKYADLADVMSATGPLMSKHGLSFSAKPTLTEHGFMLSYTLRHASGDEDSGLFPLPQPGADLKQIGIAITYARRYVFTSMLGIVSDEDTDVQHEATPQRDFPGPTRTTPLPPQAQRGRERAAARKAPQREGETGEQRDDRRRKRMFALFSEVGLNSKDEQIMFIEDVLQRALGSRAEILPEEYEKIIEALEAEERIDPTSGEVR